ncbi:hypothetical protein HRbin07_00119 [bacterium HR07]|nr:hypothetical protein HRbin07_00119 [bacterium HR07]
MQKRNDAPQNASAITVNTTGVVSRVTVICPATLKRWTNDCPGESVMVPDPGMVTVWGARPTLRNLTGWLRLTVTLAGRSAGSSVIKNSASVRVRCAATTPSASRVLRNPGRTVIRPPRPKSVASELTGR